MIKFTKEQREIFLNLCLSYQQELSDELLSCVRMDEVIYYGDYPLSVEQVEVVKQICNVDQVKWAGREPGRLPYSHATRPSTSLH